MPPSSTGPSSSDSSRAGSRKPIWSADISPKRPGEAVTGLLPTRKRSPDIWTSIRSVTGSYSSKARARIVWKRSPRSCNRKQESPFGSLRDRTAHDPHFREHCQLRPYRTCGTATAHAVPPPPRRKICRPNDKCPAQTYGSASDLRPPPESALHRLSPIPANTDTEAIIYFNVPGWLHTESPYLSVAACVRRSRILLRPLP